MKTLNIAGKTVSIDIKKLSKGLCGLHNQDEDMKLILSFGMLDAKLCDMFEKQLNQAIKAEFSELNNILFEARINDFIKDCNNEIAKGVYSFATMVV